MRIWTMDEIKSVNAAAGYHYFDASTMRFFRSRVGDTVYQGHGGVYFVTSEQFVASDGTRFPRKYTVRLFYPASGLCGTAPGYEFNRLTRADAHRAAKWLARGR